MSKSDRRAAAIDLDGQEGGQMSGVFRWRMSHKLPVLPAVSLSAGVAKESRSLPKLVLNQGWMGYFKSRCHGEENEMASLIQFVQQDLCAIDCLSFPISVAFIISKTNLFSSSDAELELLDEFHVVCMGCSEKAEERILRESAYWYELALALKGMHKKIGHIHLYLVGPEISCIESGVSSCGNVNSKVKASMTSHTFKGTAAAFFKANPKLVPLPSSTGTGNTSTTSSNTIAVGLNCGFGNWENPGNTKYDLLISWYSDLQFLVSLQNLPLLFTCANDYADLDGECYIMSELFGCNFLCNPEKNAFSCASTFVPEGTQSHGNGEEFSCGNSFWYAIMGRDVSRRKVITGGNGNGKGNGGYKLPVSQDSSPQARFEFMSNLVEGNNNNNNSSNSSSNSRTQGGLHLISHRPTWKCTTVKVKVKVQHEQEQEQEQEQAKAKEKEKTATVEKEKEKEKEKEQRERERERERERADSQQATSVPVIDIVPPNSKNSDKMIDDKKKEAIKDVILPPATPTSTPTSSLESLGSLELSPCLPWTPDVTQSIEEKQVTITCLPGHGFDVKSVNLSLDKEGKIILLRYGSEEQGQGKEIVEYSVKLETQIKKSSIKAKINVKKNKLTVTGTVKV